MKKLLLFLIVAGASVWMFQHPDELKAHSSTVFGEISRFFAGLAGEQAPVSQQPAATAEATLPDGVYCITQAVHLNHGSVQATLPAGTMVRKSGDGGNGKVLITDGTGSAVVDATLLTRDPSVVAMVRAVPHAGALSQQNQAADVASARKELQEIEKKLASLQAELSAIQTRDSFAMRYGKRIQFATSEQFVRNTIQTLESRKAQLTAAIASSTPSQ